MSFSFTEDRKTMIIVLVAVVAGILFLGGRLPFFGSIAPGYSTAHEGATVRFIGLRAPDGTLYMSGEENDATVARFDTQMKFDPDELLYGACNLRGEMTSVYIPSTSFREVLPGWVPTEWESSLSYITNPRQRWEWDILNMDGSTTEYAMEEWLTKWYFSLSAEFDTGPDYFMSNDESNNQRYIDWEVWFEFDIEPNWYFEDTDQTYFAIAKAELSEFRLGAEDKFGAYQQAAAEASIIPMSPPSIIYLYYAPFGANPVKGEEDLQTFYNRDVALNPDYFRDKVYGYITLGNFGTEEWGPLWDRKAKGDVVVMGFNIYQMVVGEWKVQDVGVDPDEGDYGRDSQTGRRGIGEEINEFMTGVGKFLDSPTGKLLGIGIFIVGAIAVLSFTPAFGTILGKLFGREVGDD